VIIDEIVSNADGDSVAEVVVSEIVSEDEA
jgi:hypothetical protein